MYGVLIVSNQPFVASMVQTILHKYFPSQTQSHLFIKNKYFSTNIPIKICTYSQLIQISKQQHKIDCLLLVTSLMTVEHNLIAKDLKSITGKTDPISQLLLINGLEGEDIDLERFYEESDCFVEALTLNIETEIEGEVKQLPKSLVDDAEGVLRLAQIIDSTSWRIAKKQTKVSEQKTANPKLQTESAPKSITNNPSTISPPPGINIFSQGIDNKLEKDMNHFSALMDQMLSLKGQSLPDSERKEKAADLIMKLAMSLEGEEGQDEDEFNEFEE